MWDERYSADEYAYGTEPNDFLRENFHSLPQGKVLSLAEGEGRNAVFLARSGFQVTAVDSSIVGLDKGKRLAARHDADVEFVHADLADYDIGRSAWDAIISIFCPLPSEIRHALHRQVESGLKKNGVYLVEAYTPAQVLNDTGGGKDQDLMQTKASLVAELAGLQFDHLVELERDILEG
ncbi:MAG: class I SAM-dependent methyltransferase [Pseudomonadota bacterium]